MTDREEERRQFEQLDALANRSAHKFFSFSPNDVLVQVALPLVLILAIATRLMTIGQAAASQQRSPAILDLWKQQLILRLDGALNRWEQEAHLPAMPDFERILWKDGWPADDRFQSLCRQATALDELPGFVDRLYASALQYQPAEGGDAPTNAFAYIARLHDPEVAGPADGGAEVPPEFRITPERRAFAKRYIEERARKWAAQVEVLQWSAVERVAKGMPIQEGDEATSPAAQMRQIARQFEARGYPLLDAVKEY